MAPVRQIKTAATGRTLTDGSPPRTSRPLQAGNPLLMVDIDGVISLFGFEADRRPPGAFHAIEGIPHFLSTVAAEQLARLAAHFDLIWASGWEERANEHLPALLGLPGPLPFLRFEGRDGRTGGLDARSGSLHGHWKLAAIEAHAGGRALAWVDDALDQHCERWAARRAAPTLLVPTEPAVGLTATETALLTDWAGSL